MAEETESKIEEFWSVLLCQAGFSDVTADTYKRLVVHYYKKYDEIEPQKIEEFAFKRTSVDKERKRIKRALQLFYDWTTSGKIPEKDTKRYQKKTVSRKSYRPRCKQNCVHNHIGRCTYPNDENAEFIIPTRCIFFENENEDGREHEKRRIQVGDNGLKIVYRDSHSVMYGGRIDS